MEETFRHQFIKAIEDCRTALDDVKKKKEISNDDDNYQPISNEEKVKEYLEEIKDIPKEKIVYINETGIIYVFTVNMDTHLSGDKGLIAN